MPSLPTVQASVARIYVDEFELTQQSAGAQLNAETQTLTYNIMGESSSYQDVTTPSFTIEHNGYYTGRGASDNLGYFEDSIRSRLGTTTPVIVSLTLGNIMYALESTWDQEMTVDAPVAELITINAKWASAKFTRRCEFIARGDFTDLANSTAVNAGPSGAFNGFVVHASGFADLTAGAETVTVNLQTSATQGGAYTTLWSKVFKKPGAFVVTGADNVNSWMRLQVDFTAGVPGPVHAMAGVIYK
jgi:hypothetical protein